MIDLYRSMSLSMMYLSDNKEGFSEQDDVDGVEEGRKEGRFF